MCIVFYRNLIHNVDTIPDELLEPFTVALSFSFIQFGLVDFINSVQYIPDSLFVPLQFGVCLDSLVRDFLGYGIKLRHIIKCFISEKRYSSYFMNMINWVAYCFLHPECATWGNTYVLLTIHIPLPVRHEIMYSIKCSSLSRET
jgi:hypothetical protein